MQVLKLVSLGRARHIVKAMSRSLLIVTHEPEVSGLIPGRAYTFVSPCADSRRAVVSYWQKYVHEVLVRTHRMSKHALEKCG